MTEHKIIEVANDIVRQNSLGTQKFKMSMVKVPSIHFSTFDFSECNRIILDFENKKYDYDFMYDLVEFFDHFSKNLPPRMAGNFGNKLTMKNVIPKMAFLLHGVYHDFDKNNTPQVPQDNKEGTER